MKLLVIYFLIFMGSPSVHKITEYFKSLVHEAIRMRKAARILPGREFKQSFERILARLYKVNSLDVL